MRTNLTKSMRNSCWLRYVGEAFKGTCFTGCGVEITMFNFECGHVVSVDKGGENKLDNLRPICGTCNKSMGTKNMIDFINEAGYKANKLEKVDSTKAIKYTNITLPSYYLITEYTHRVPVFTKIGCNVYISAHTYPLEQSIPGNVIPEITDEIKLSDDYQFIENGSRTIPISEFDPEKIKPIRLSIEMIKTIKLGNKKITEKDILYILESINFDIDSRENDYLLELYKIVHVSRLIPNNKYRPSEYKLELGKGIDEFTELLKKNNNFTKPEEFIKIFMLDNLINITC